MSHCRGIKEEIEEKDGGRLPQDGWKQVCQSDRMGIYCCSREEAPPFGSTAKEELEAVRGIGIKRYLFSGLLVFAAALLQEWTFFHLWAGILQECCLTGAASWESFVF